MVRAWGVALVVWALLPASARAGGPGIEALRQRLGGEDEAAATRAAVELGASSDPRALAVLLEALRLGAPPPVQAAMLDGLAAKREPAALPLLERYAHNRHPELRQKSLAALARLDDPRATAALLAALSDSAAEVRAQAAQALGQRRERSAESKLLRLLDRGDAAAAPALAAIATPEVVQRLGERIGQLPDALVCAALAAMLKRTDFGPEPLRVEVVRTLGRMPGVDATATLLDYVAQTTGDKARASRVEAERLIQSRGSP